uniref:calcium and integrin-binding protein 1-like n=1 Tax=Styela clava TaxID=7725 RepID=UPI00193A45EA|nr:calcium and integrin-binding protein 1-like [Styela clava]
MGLSSSVFTREELEEYADLTYFTEGEIIDLHKKFMSLVDDDSKDKKSSRISKERMMELPEIKFNPFADRLCDVFSTSEEEDSSMSFDDFLDMMNALSENASFKLKAQYAFRVFDINENGFVDPEDIEEIVMRLTKDEGLGEKELMDELIESMMVEADLDKDGQLSLAELEHVLSKSADFMNSFKIRV